MPERLSNQSELVASGPAKRIAADSSPQRPITLLLPLLDSFIWSPSVVPLSAFVPPAMPLAPTMRLEES